MKKYRIEATAVTTYEIVVEAENETEAITRATSTQDSFSKHFGEKWEAIDESDFAIDKNSIEEVV